MMQKRGVSEVISVVLVIFIVVAGISILWISVNALLRNSSFTDSCRETDLSIDNSGYSCYDSVKNMTYVTVKKGSSEVNITGVNFLIEANGNSVSYNVYETIPINSARAFDLNTTGYSNISEVSIAPIVTSGKKEKVCAVSSKYNLPACGGSVASSGGTVVGSGGSSNSGCRSNSECNNGLVCTSGRCVSNAPVVVTNGVCGSSINICTAGDLLDLTDNTTHSLWNCSGSNGGINVSCNVQTVFFITGQGVLNQAGKTYILQNNINCPTGNCLNITADNITLDLNGKILNGTSSSIDTAGIYLNGKKNITIFNGQINNFYMGLQFINGTYINVTNLYIAHTIQYSHPIWGIYLNSVNNSLFNILSTSSLIGSVTCGLDLVKSSDNLFSGSINLLSATGNDIVRRCDGNSFRNNVSSLTHNRGLISGGCWI
ncbi:hypothetical protein KA107_00310 [Candidatus Pacearchaeota archaeon]|nr:hypothetical protein [Candidatus Pacearchaeota archaeon]